MIKSIRSFFKRLWSGPTVEELAKEADNWLTADVIKNLEIHHANALTAYRQGKLTKPQLYQDVMWDEMIQNSQ